MRSPHADSTSGELLPARRRCSADASLHQTWRPAIRSKYCISCGVRNAAAVRQGGPNRSGHTVAGRKWRLPRETHVSSRLIATCLRMLVSPEMHARRERGGIFYGPRALEASVWRYEPRGSHRKTCVSASHWKRWRRPKCDC